MRLTFVLPTVNLSGGIRVAAIYAQELTQRGHTVRLVSRPPRAVSTTDKIKSVLRGNGWPASRPNVSHLDGAGLDHRVVDCWRPITDADVPDGDVVIATWWETAEWVAALSPSKGARVYFVQHQEVHPHLPLARVRATYRAPMHKIVVARWLKDVMADRYGDATVDLIPNSVDHAQFFAAPRGKQAVPTAGFLYSRAAFKGVDVTLSALERVRQRMPELRLVAFGSQPPDGDAPLPDNVEFILRPAQHSIRDIYAACDVWVTASRSEGFNLPAMEAMACRSPVVATRTGWPEEAVATGHNGVLVDVDDVAGLAQGIEWVLTRNDREWRRLSENACATVAESSWQKSAEMFEAALEHACRRADLGEIGGGARQAAQSGAKQRQEAS
jgi:glycosyltransferase involved in cell wall biosynthesis